MTRRPPRPLAAALLLAALPSAARAQPQPQPQPQPIRGVLVTAGQATPGALAAWKAEGGNAVAVVLDESGPRARWSVVAADAERARLALYAWVEVARNPALADAHPDWMAAPGGHHDDWRRRFPDAPAARRGAVVKAWPWVPIGYAPAFEAHRRRLDDLLDGLPGRWAGVFLNDLQAGPSSCGCGNDQCRWALDYGSPATAPTTPGDDAAARVVAALQARHPGKAVIPVWVTECQSDDTPRAEGGTGHCGTVGCFRGACWTRYARSWDPLLKAASGPVAVALWTNAFDRDSRWIATALSLFRDPPRGSAVAPSRVVAVVPGWDPAGPDPAAAARSRAGATAGGGYLVARTKVDQSWEPRLVSIPR